MQLGPVVKSEFGRPVVLFRGSSEDLDSFQPESAQLDFLFDGFLPWIDQHHHQLTVGDVPEGHQRCGASPCIHPNGASGDMAAELGQGPETLGSAESGPGAFEQAQASRLGFGGEYGAVEPGPAPPQQVADDGLGQVQSLVHFIAVAGRNCELSLPQVEIVSSDQLVDGIGPLAWLR